MKGDRPRPENNRRKSINIGRNNPTKKRDKKKNGVARKKIEKYEIRECNEWLGYVHARSREEKERK